MLSTELRTQGDFKARVVTVANLIAMCDRASGTSDRWTVLIDSGHRVAISWSNPDEYGAEVPIRFSLPAFPNPHEVANSYVLVGEVVRVTGGRSKDERDMAYQALDALIASAPALYRPEPYSGDWRTAEEWRATGEEKVVYEAAAG